MTMSKSDLYIYCCLFSGDLLPGPVVQVTGPVCSLQRPLQSHESSKLPEVSPRLAQLLEAGGEAGLLGGDIGQYETV